MPLPWVVLSLLAVSSRATSITGVGGIPEGYAIHDRAMADFDGDGVQETAYALAWARGAEPGAQPPRLWVVRDGKRVLDLWLAQTNALLRNVGPEQDALQTGDLTGDGRPELLFVPSSAGGSGGTQFPRVATWTGSRFENVKLRGRTLAHISENGGAVIRPGRPNLPAVLILFNLQQPGPRRYRAQRFHFRAGSLVGERERVSRRTGKAGLRELGIK
ncbi:MAG TPA: hypothetical protein VK689_02710 [Armatimonadota bacterium]|nr:hypothetical protein [Armatimonadota bacterium]